MLNSSLPVIPSDSQGKNSAGSETGEREAISVPEFQMEFLPVNLFLFTEGWWEEEVEEEL